MGEVDRPNPGASFGACLGMLIMGGMLYYSINNIQDLHREKIAFDDVLEVIPVEQDKQAGARPRSRRGLLLGLIISGVAILSLLGVGFLVGVYNRWNSEI